MVAFPEDEAMTERRLVAAGLREEVIGAGWWLTAWTWPVDLGADLLLPDDDDWP
ncbi:MAG: hypothetical protein H6732_19335 [Alphaproteobacteria bacterium]|nr:hypothetical protein [Alphaproteobacteria bacterium]